MEYVNCNFCNENDTKRLFSKKDKFAISKESFVVVKCSHCGLIYVNPRPDRQEIVKFYPDTYSWKETLEASSQFTKTIRKLERVYRYHLLNYEVNKVVKFTNIRIGRVLDIGCGSGDRLDVFRKLGFETFGVDVSSSADYARDILKLNVKRSTLFGTNYPESFFDIVTLYNVLEHMHSPKEILEEIHRILKDDGFVVIQVPNTDCLQFRLFKEKWAALDVPRDLYYFNSGLLAKLLRDPGFDIQKIDQFTNWWHPPTIVVTLFPGLDPATIWLEEKKNRNVILKRFSWIFWTIFLSPLTFFESLIRKSAIVTVYAKKFEEGKKNVTTTN